MSVLGKCENEMAAIHLIKTNFLPTLMYGCEVWSISDNSLHTVSVSWNNCFIRLLFSSAAGESASNRFGITAILSPFPTLLTKED